jgi:hypothetical protein
MSNGKHPQQDKKVELTESQQNPYLARPEDFKINGDSVDGQSLPASQQQREAETANASKFTGRTHGPDVNHAGKPHTKP